LIIQKVVFHPFAEALRIEYEVGSRIEHDTHSGTGATIQAMELDPVGGIIMHLAGGRFKYFQGIPMVLDLVDDSKVVKNNGQ